MPRPSSPGETARKHTDAGDDHPSLGARDCFLRSDGRAQARAASSESDSILCRARQALARRRESTRMLAMITQASALAIVFSDRTAARKHARPPQSLTQYSAAPVKPWRDGAKAHGCWR